MSGEPDNLLLEHLRAVRSDMARMADDMRTLRSEMTALSHQLSIVVSRRADRSDGAQNELAARP